MAIQVAKKGKDPVRNKILDFSELSKLRDRFPGKKIVHCHGVFDLLHPGHLAYFQSAKVYGELLVVTVTADEFVNKGPGRPHFSSPVRIQMLSALEIVDFVAISNFANACQVIGALKPHFYVKGPDYRDRSKDPTGAIYLEEQAARQYGGSLVFTDDEVQSSTNIINKYFQSWSADQRDTIEQVQKAGGIDKIEEIIHEISNERVLVIGEPIVDTYVFCHPESISNKGSSISARYLYEENYAGGSLANANHLADFANEVTLLITHGAEPYFLKLLEAKLDKRVKLIAQELSDIPTPKKTRFIGVDKIQRLFEITEIRNDQWTLHRPDKFCKLMEECSKGTTLSLVTDYGHGIFEGQVLEAINTLTTFIGLNVQTNSSNMGFNFFPKHGNFSYLSTDTKEARLAYQDRHSTPLELVRRIHRDFPDKAIAMTLGHQGSYFYAPKGEKEILVPAFDDDVLDPVGAGDAYFALTALLVKVGCPDVMIPFIGNVFAGLKTKIVGNKSSVSRLQLMRALKSILK